MKPPAAGQDFDLPEFAPAKDVAALFGRPYRTIQGWARRGLVRHQIVRGVLLVATLEVVREDWARRANLERRGPKRPDCAPHLTDPRSSAS